VIIGFANYDIVEKSVFEYEDIKGEAHEIKVKNINPYLVEGKDITDKQKKTVEKAAENVLSARQEFPKYSLADLYNPLTMPPKLVKVHQDLDKAVDLAYRSQPFTSEAKRIAFLFELYEKYTTDLFTKEKAKKSKKKLNDNVKSIP
jgi:hypothetical protein